MTALATENWLFRVVRSAFLADVRWPKAGNVSRTSPGHGMRAVHFERSAGASACALIEAGPGVGERARAGVAATRAVVECNTNLGLLLLAAPLVEAALDPLGRGGLGSRLARVLARLSRVDAEAAFTAIRMAAPGGLGRSARHDVADAPQGTLRQAMAEAAPRDLVARQYVTGFAEILEWGVEELAWRLAQTGSRGMALAELQLGFASRHPDSHVQRKRGQPVAASLQERARATLRHLRAAPGPAQWERRLSRFDAELKAEGINPGTSADLTVATLIALRLHRRAARERRERGLALCGTGQGRS